MPLLQMVAPGSSAQQPRLRLPRSDMVHSARGLSLGCRERMLGMGWITAALRALSPGTEGRLGC